MRARLLGTAAGGGLPQWNCACATCTRSRRQGTGRTQDCLAVTGTGRRWYLVNASPDIRAQVLAAPELSPGPGRETPVRGVLLTDGELDHSIGLLMLREGAPLDVYGPEPVLEALRESFPVRGILAPYGAVSWHRVSPGETISLDEQLSVTAFPVSMKVPRYAAASPQVTPAAALAPAEAARTAEAAGTAEASRTAEATETAEAAGIIKAAGIAEAAEAAEPWVVAYRFEDRVGGGTLVYAPCLAAWASSLDEALAGAECVILDGTFFHDDEMLRATGQDRPARAMGHLPITDTCPRLRAHPAARKIYTHLNNTNPVLYEDSPERATLQAAGIEVADDGLMLDL